MYKYAQINENGMVEGISYLAGEVMSPYMILLNGSHRYDEKVDLSWSFINGEWVEPDLPDNIR